MKTAKTPLKTERECDFELILSGPEQLLDLGEKIVDAFFEVAGGDLSPEVFCGIPRAGCTYRAAAMKDAILSAIADVRKVGHGVDVVAVEWPSPLTQAEIAQRIGKSRQLVHQYIRGQTGPGGFPSPARTGVNGQPMWRWSDAAAWLVKHSLAPQPMLADAETVETINSVLDCARNARQHAALVREVNSVLKAAKMA